MNYPVWEVTGGGGLLIAIVSILHVFVSHFAIGGGLWLVATETLARRRGDAGLLAHVRAHGRFFILLTLVFGAITGVGIWITIGLVSPATVSTLVRAYVLGWAMEWVFFVVEIAAALVYYYGWDRLPARTHLAVGWIYFVAAWASLAIINGIVTFMLTPGDWLVTRAFWDGFFNPTYWPSLVLRTGAAVGLAGVLTLLSATRLRDGSLRTWATRYSAGWLLGGLAVVWLASGWYRGAFPAWDDVLGGLVPVVATAHRWWQLGALAVGVLGLGALLGGRRWPQVASLILVAVALGTFGAGEWIREAGRKPFTIRDYLYSTGLRVTDRDAVATAGLAASTRWIDPAARADDARLGRELWRAHCLPCHTLDGYNGLRPSLARWDEGTLAEIVPRLEHLRGPMPPWLGDGRETAALVRFLHAEGGRGDSAWPDDPARARRLAWDLSCGLCHTADGYLPLRASLAGMGREELDELLDMLPDLTEAMPPYERPAAERALLLDHLGELAGGSAADAGELAVVAPDGAAAGDAGPGRRTP